jgi:hypothetical protein
MNSVSKLEGRPRHLLQTILTSTYLMLHFVLRTRHTEYPLTEYRSPPHHSYLKVFAGLLIAALIVWALTVINAIKIAAMAARMYTRTFISI